MNAPVAGYIGNLSAASYYDGGSPSAVGAVPGKAVLEEHQMSAGLLEPDSIGFPSDSPLFVGIALFPLAEFGSGALAEPIGDRLAEATKGRRVAERDSVRALLK